MLVLTCAAAASAEVKVYNSNKVGGTPGDEFTTAPQTCPTVTSNLGSLRGSATISDTGSGTVTLDDLEIRRVIAQDFNTELFFGPGSFVFVDVQETSRPTPGQTGTGSTAPTSGSVSWGILGGWTRTGTQFCVASPTSLCTIANFIHGTTVTAPIPSTTYDLGTWSFDAEGDYTATPYIQTTLSGGTANTQYALRGAYVGAALPALPLVGFGALSLALVGIGARSLRKK